MSKHSRLALLIAPFLILGGYIASDLYIENKASESRVFQLEPIGNCDVLNKSCILQSGDFEISVYDEAGITKVNTTFPLDSVMLFLVDKHQDVSIHQLGMLESPYYWQRSTNLRELVSDKGAKYKLRLIANIKGGQYISEFYTQTVM